MDIIYKDENIDFFKSKWKEFLDNNKTSYRYLLLNIDYALFYTNNLIFDKSFVVIENNKCVGICFLPIENIDSINQISLAGGFTLSPLAQSERIEKKIYKEIEQICADTNIKKIMFYIDPLIIQDSNSFNRLLRYGFVDASTTDCMVNLKLTKGKLWSNLNKSYKPLINGIKKNQDFKIKIFNYQNANYDIHELYRQLHHKCAGKITRSKDTFDKQYEMLVEDKALLIGLNYQNEFIGFNYFFHHDKTAIYASGADDPKYENSKIAIYHPILWSAIEYYHEKDYQYLEFSQPCGFNNINGFYDYLDKKQQTISSFKRGMGAQMISFYRGIKYFDKNLIILDIIEYNKKAKGLNK